ncbi:DUF5665 domain-containing protein [Maritimibacter sp. UBA3975]|nr:DUF5665 domain-containing protein [Maritimibacter sp. UBA3975]
MADENQPTDLTAEVRNLRSEVAKLNQHRYIRLHDSLVQLGLFQVYRGLAFGLGSVLGATILVSVAAYLLAQIDFIPIIGDWAGDIAREIDADNAESYGLEEDSAPEEGDAEAAQENPSPGGPPVEDDGVGPSDFGIAPPDAE